MRLVIRAEYRGGQIHLLEPVALQEGQQLTINVETITDDDALRAALGD